MPVSPEENAHSENCAAPGAAVEYENAHLTTWLDAYPIALDAAQRDAIRRLIRYDTGTV